jgi:hypothetical protein
LQGQPGQVGLENLGAAMGGQLLMLRLGPQAIAHAGLQAPGTAGALGGAGAGDALGVEAGHAAAGVEARHPGQAGVDHHAHAVDGQAGLGDVGGQHHLAQALGAGSMAARWALRSSSPCSGQSRISGARPRPPEGWCTRRISACPGRNTSTLPVWSASACNTLSTTRGSMNSPAGTAAPSGYPPDACALRCDHRGVVQQPRQALAFQGRGHQQDLQRRLVTQQLAAIEAQRQRQVGVQAAFVEFVEDQQAHAFQRRVGLQAAVRMPSVTTSMRVLGPTLLSRRMR